MKLPKIFYLYIQWILGEIYIFARQLLRNFTKNTVVKNKAKDRADNEFHRFIEVNRLKWKSFDGRRSKNGTLIIEGLCDHPLYLTTNLIIGFYIAQCYEVSLTGLLRSRNKKLETLFKSYGVRDFIYLEDRKHNFFYNIKYSIRAIKILKKIDGIEDLLELKLKGVYIGKTIYDDCLRYKGIGTIDKISHDIFRRLVIALSYLDFIDIVIDKEKTPIIIQSERQFIPSAIIFQTAVNKGLTVYSRGGGPTSITIAKYHSPKDIYRNTYRYSRKVFDYVYANYRDRAVKSGGEYIFNRFNGNLMPNDIPDAQYSFRKEERIVSRKELCERFGWDEQRLIVGVMSNMLTDGVYTNNWALFKDNLTWLRSTLQIIEKIDHINWFVKAHPSDKKNKVKTSSKSEYERWCANCRHVRFLPEDVGSRSLPGIVDRILTAHGSAGIEYSCFGIPCILGGESLYSGLGFTYEPRSQKEYFNMLKYIHNLKPLNGSQIEKAKVFAYIYLVLSRVKCNLVPACSVFADYDEEMFWKEAAILIQKNDPMKEKLGKMVQIQIMNEHRHLLNYDGIGLDVKNEK